MADDAVESDESRPYTREEVRQQFLEHLVGMAWYWTQADLTRARPPTMPTLTVEQDRKERCEGMAFSMLCLLDGVSAGFPGCRVTVHPHPDDEEFHKSEGEFWYADGTEVTDDGIMLHDMMGATPKVRPDLDPDVIIGRLTEERDAARQALADLQQSVAATAAATCHNKPHGEYDPPCPICDVVRTEFDDHLRANTEQRGR